MSKIWSKNTKWSGSMGNRCTTIRTSSVNYPSGYLVRENRIQRILFPSFYSFESNSPQKTSKTYRSPSIRTLRQIFHSKFSNLYLSQSSSSRAYQEVKASYGVSSKYFQTSYWLHDSCLLPSKKATTLNVIKKRKDKLRTKPLILSINSLAYQ